MPKLLILLTTVVFLSIGFCFIANADTTSLTGYVYSESVGWISLSCSNTDSCGSINYGVSSAGSGILFGYGYSQNGEWINFNPNYGGADINSDGEVSGWIFGEDTGWINISASKIVSGKDLQNKAESAKNIVSEYENTGIGSLSEISAANLLSSLCNVLGISQCSDSN